MDDIVQALERIVSELEKLKVKAIGSMGDGWFAVHHACEAAQLEIRKALKELS